MVSRRMESARYCPSRNASNSFVVEACDERRIGHLHSNDKPIPMNTSAARKRINQPLALKLGDGTTTDGLAGDVARRHRFRAPADSLHDGGDLDSWRAGEALRHPDPASVA